ncbi:MAG: DUF2269 family protein [Dehalococcoidia bacterium]
MRDVLLVLHILSAFLFVAGALTTTMLDLYARGSTATRTLGMAADVQRKAGLFAVVPGAVLALVFGSWLVVEVGFGFGEAWISASYALWIVALALGPAMLGSHHRRVKQQADRLLAQGVETSPDLQREFNAPLAKAISGLIGLIIIALVYLMVAKPGA